MTDIKLRTITDYDVILTFKDKKELKEYLKLERAFIREIKRALEKTNFKGDETLIKRYIYDMWGHSDFDGPGMPLLKDDEMNFNQLFIPSTIDPDRGTT